MKNWEKAEKIVKHLTSGKQTIGSGNKGQEGDVIAHGYHIEVKQTDKGSISIQMQWLKTIERIYSEQDLDGVLVIFMKGLEGSCYVLDRARKQEPYKKWTSKKYLSGELPEYITTEKFVWVLQPLSFLTTLKDDVQDDV